MSGFKARTIKKIIRGKLRAWMNTIDDVELKAAISKDVIVTGGAIASMLLGEEVKDFDIYFRTQETALLVANHYTKIFAEDYKKRNGSEITFIVGVDEIKNLHGFAENVVRIKGDRRNGAFIANTDTGLLPDAEEAEAAAIILAEEGKETEQQVLENNSTRKYFPVYISENAVTLSNKIQLVMRFTGNAEEIHENYDFIHCMNVYDYDADELHLNPKALESLMSKTLYYSGSLYPLCSMFRAKKFIERGWRISAGELLKIMFQTSKIDFNDVEQLREQLVGIDALYFHNLIRLLESAKQKGQTVIVRCIDEIFNN